MKRTSDRDIQIGCIDDTYLQIPLICVMLTNKRCDNLMSCITKA